MTDALSSSSSEPGIILTPSSDGLWPSGDITFDFDTRSGQRSNERSTPSELGRGPGACPSPVYVFNAGRERCEPATARGSAPAGGKSRVVISSRSKQSSQRPSVAVSASTKTNTSSGPQTESSSSNGAIYDHIPDETYNAGQEGSHRAGTPQIQSLLNLNAINAALDDLDVDQAGASARHSLSSEPRTPLQVPYSVPRRKSSPRAPQPRYRVEEEEILSDTFHTATFQESLTATKRLMKNLSNVLEDGLMQFEQGSTIRSLQETAKKLACFEPSASRTVGLVGDSGVGESDGFLSL